MQEVLQGGKDSDQINSAARMFLQGSMTSVVQRNNNNNVLHNHQSGSQQSMYSMSASGSPTRISVANVLHRRNVLFKNVRNFSNLYEDR